MPYSSGMSARTPVLLGVGVIAVLFGGAVLVVDRLFSEADAPRPARASSPAPPGAAAPVEPDLRLPPQAPLAPPPAPAPGAAAPPPVAPGPPAPAPAGRDLLTSLDAARARILECGGVDLGEPEQGGRAQRAALRQEAARPRTVLLLDLEPQEGQMAVRALEVVSQGGHDGEDLVRCARQELEGRLLEAANAHPGRRLKMQFVVDRQRR